MQFHLTFRSSRVPRTLLRPRLTTLLSAAALAWAAAGPAQAQVTGGQSILTFSQDAVSTLTLIGVTVAAAGTAGTVTPGVAFSFPVAGGTVLDNQVASVDTDPNAGVTLTRGSTVITLYRFKLDVAAKRLRGDINVNGSVSPGEDIYEVRSIVETPATPPWRDLAATGLYLTPGALKKLGDALGVPEYLRPTVAQVDFGRLDGRLQLRSREGAAQH
ncbi:hypothetical protein OOT46_08485 [Aquabacterium sp. A7-Y]|uniref:hypothetical protein n=1 Tax=Aquabacterium sp. A7-Y TaxID=1349605 RepID=UPI00223C9B8C|nr:hypothetical protein [Aquabacterium sp. A7-Y]MCW7537884.1 hypothetical protein [Aquabacterium sp. A7-Y]